MDRHSEKPAKHFGLLANGSSGPWDISIDESLDRDNEWFVEIECPRNYMLFQLRDLDVVAEALSFLQLHLKEHAGVARCEWTEEEDTLALGKFGPGSVSLVWDRPEFRRCFIVMDQEGGVAMRVTLEEDDVENLIDAFHQVANDLPARSG